MTLPPAGSRLLKICRTPPICVRPGDTVREATRVMVQNRVGAVAVVEDDVLVGILTERDLMVKVTNRDADPASLLVGDTMEPDVRTIAPDASHSEAATAMLEQHCRHLPVTDADGKILGMLSIRHLYREQLRRLQGQMDSLEAYTMADGPGG
jgi:CBS domain-containing protein